MESGKVIGQLDSINKMAEEGAIEALNGLEQCVAGVDGVLQDLAKIMAGGDLSGLNAADTKLRKVQDGLYATMNSLQFQDINTQKLRKVMAMLAELNDYLNELVGFPKPRPTFVVAKNIEGTDLVMDKNKAQVDALVKEFQNEKTLG